MRLDDMASRRRYGAVLSTGDGLLSQAHDMCGHVVDVALDVIDVLPDSQYIVLNSPHANNK
jgi:hypothetical protein